jgi:hypothetical protein
MNKNLSPAAQAIEDAYFNADGFGYRNGLAAALCAVADQCHSQEIREADYTTRLWICVDELLAIAAELKGA